MVIIEEITNILNRIYDEIGNYSEISLETITPKDGKFDHNYYLEKYDIPEERFHKELNDLFSKIETKESRGFFKYLEKNATVLKVSSSTKALVLTQNDFVDYMGAYTINKIVEEKYAIINEERKKTKKELKKSISFLRNLIVSLSKHNARNANISEIKSKMKEANLLDVDKDDLIRKINAHIQLTKKKALIAKERERKKQELLKQQELLEENNNEELSNEDKFVNNICALCEEYEDFDILIKKYGHLFPDGIEDKMAENLFGYEEIKEIAAFTIEEIDKEIFTNVCISIINILNKRPSNLDIIKLYEQICIKYEYNLMLDELDSLIVNICKSHSIETEDSNILATYQIIIHGNKKVITPTSENIINMEVLKKDLHRIRDKYIVTKDSEIEKTTINSIVLFDGERNENDDFVPYVLSDLDINNSSNQIDPSVEKAKIARNGYEDFNKIIEDIFIYGKAKILLNRTDRINKFVRPVYNLDSAHDNINTQMKNATGIVRIRPGMNTYVRFFDERVEYQEGTEKFKQIKEIIEEKLPNAHIRDDKPFAIFINYLDAFKRKSLSSYKQVRLRHNISEIREVLVTKNDKYSDTDLELIKEYIDTMINTCSNLKLINENFDFKLIDKLTEKSKVKKKIEID